MSQPHAPIRSVSTAASSSSGQAPHTPPPTPPPAPNAGQLLWTPTPGQDLTKSLFPLPTPPHPSGGR
jgi:hypothetical protein